MDNPKPSMNADFNISVATETDLEVHLRMSGLGFRGLGFRVEGLWLGVQAFRV